MNLYLEWNRIILRIYVVSLNLFFFYSKSIHNLYIGIKRLISWWTRTIKIGFLLTMKIV